MRLSDGARVRGREHARRTRVPCPPARREGAGLVHYAGEKSQGEGRDLHLFGAALAVGVARVTQLRADR